MRRLGKIRTYDELMQYDRISDRFRYLELGGKVGIETFGSHRYLNQAFYNSDEWKAIRREVILRDLGCDLGVEDYDIFGRVHIHHMNPIDVDDIIHSTEWLLDPNYLITTSAQTHRAIHYGDISMLPATPVQRRPFDTCPWKGAR